MDPRLPETDLVIFDCDGVLVDSEALSCRCLAEAMVRAGIEISTEQVLADYVALVTHVKDTVAGAAGCPVRGE